MLSVLNKLTGVRFFNNMYLQLKVTLKIIWRWGWNMNIRYGEKTGKNSDRQDRYWMHSFVSRMNRNISEKSDRRKKESRGGKARCKKMWWCLRQRWQREENGMRRLPWRQNREHKKKKKKRPIGSWIRFWRSCLCAHRKKRRKLKKITQIVHKCAIMYPYSKSKEKWGTVWQ